MRLITLFAKDAEEAMTILDLSDPLFDCDAEPGFSFCDWMLHAHVGMHDMHAMRTHYRRRIQVTGRDPDPSCDRDAAAREPDSRTH